MRKRKSLFISALVASAALAGFSAAWAEEDESPAVVVKAKPSAVVPPARANPLRGKLLDGSALDSRRGGNGVNDMKLSGVVADNRAINVTTGSNLVTEGAFTNASGLPMLIQNTGNNVLIQNATIVNVQVN